MKKFPKQEMPELVSASQFFKHCNDNDEDHDIEQSKDVQFVESEMPELESLSEDSVGEEQMINNSLESSDFKGMPDLESLTIESEVYGSHVEELRCKTSKKEMEKISLPNIVQIAVSAKLNTLVALVQQAGLVETLSTASPLTVFAPTEQAFQNLIATIDGLGVDSSQFIRDNLTQVLLHHVVQAEKAIDSKTLVTLETVTPLSKEPLSVDSIQVASADVKASNGIVHVISAVLVPPSVGEKLQQAAALISKKIQSSMPDLESLSFNQASEMPDLESLSLQQSRQSVKSIASKMPELESLSIEQNRSMSEFEKKLEDSLSGSSSVAINSQVSSFKSNLDEEQFAEEEEEEGDEDDELFAIDESVTFDESDKSLSDSSMINLASPSDFFKNEKKKSCKFFKTHLKKYLELKKEEHNQDNLVVLAPNENVFGERESEAFAKKFKNNNKALCNYIENHIVKFKKDQTMPLVDNKITMETLGGKKVVIDFQQKNKKLYLNSFGDKKIHKNNASIKSQDMNDQVTLLIHSAKLY